MAHARLAKDIGAKNTHDLTYRATITALDVGGNDTGGRWAEDVAGLAAIRSTRRSI